MNEAELYKDLGKLTKDKARWEESIPYVSSLLAHDSAKIQAKALWLLGARASAQAEGVQSFSVTGLSETYAVKGRPSSIAPAAWRIISYGVDGQGGRKKGPAWLL